VAEMVKKAQKLHFPITEGHTNLLFCTL